MKNLCANYSRLPCLKKINQQIAETQIHTLPDNNNNNKKERKTIILLFSSTHVLKTIGGSKKWASGDCFATL